MTTPSEQIDAITPSFMGRGNDHLCQIRYKVLACLHYVNFDFTAIDALVAKAAKATLHEITDILDELVILVNEFMRVLRKPV